MTVSVVLLAAALTPPGEYQLRNVAAADVARSILVFAGQRRMDVVVAADPIRNVLQVSGEPVACRRVGELVAAIDRRPPQAACELLVVQAESGFADSVGLGLSAHAATTLTPREVQMLTAAVSHAKRAGKSVDIISRPMLVVVDNQTGLFEVGSPESGGLLARITPRLTPDGKTLLRAELRLTTRVNGVGADGFATSESQVTAQLENGGGLVTRGLVGAANDGRPLEVLWIVTVRRIEPDTPQQ